MIFFHDKHWLQHEPLFTVAEVDEHDEGDDDDDDNEEAENPKPNQEETPADSRRADRPASRASLLTVTSAPSKKQEYEFLLFNYLLRFVHREGQIGDFARAGLLFLMDVAMSPHGPANKAKVDRLSTGQSSPDAVADAALALAEYILDSDFSEVLGAGLGAVYSLLPSKVEFRPQPVSDAYSSTGMILGIGNAGSEQDEELEDLEREKRRAIGLEDASNPDFRSRLDHFLKLLEFLQDVIRRNTLHESPNTSLDASTLVGTAIVQSILDAVQRIFLENVLYPSILECSDNDGSAVAVMSYIEIMIRTLPDGQLSDLLVNFLTSEDNDEIHRQPRAHPVLTLNGDVLQATPGVDVGPQSKLQRRKSSAMMLLEMEAPESSRRSEYFTSMGRFTLKDLLISNMRSKFQPSATAALQLFDSLLHRHPQVCMDKLLVVIPDENATSFPSPSLNHEPYESSLVIHRDDPDYDVFLYPGAKGPTTDSRQTLSVPSIPHVFAQPKMSYATHEREMDLYLALVSRVDPSHSSEAFSTGYEHYLHDALCTISGSNAYHYEDPTESRKHVKHRLNPNDPFLSILLESLRRFFSNTPEYNIVLTGVLATLAMHPDRSLAGWLTFTLDGDPPRGEHRELEYPDDSDDRSVDFRINEMESNPLPTAGMSDQSWPVVHSILQNLVGQLEHYRLVVGDFDKFLFERRQGLLFSENLTDALTLALDIADEPNPSLPSESPAQLPKAKVKASSSFMSFLTPKKRSRPSPIPSEPTSPPRSNKKLDASPFGPHYERTSAIVVEPFVAPITPSSSWTPARSAKWTADVDDVFGSSEHWGETRETLRRDDNANEVRHVTLSRLLDNVVILEEAIKELVAVVHARRSLGIDAVRYV